jgi:hypothetical protein
MASNGVSFSVALVSIVIRRSPLLNYIGIFRHVNEFFWGGKNGIRGASFVPLLDRVGSSSALHPAENAVNPWIFGVTSALRTSEGLTKKDSRSYVERTNNPLQEHCFSEDSREASPQTKVAIISPLDEHCSRTCQITIRTFSSHKFKRNICQDAEATLESFSTHAHHAER